MSRVWRKASFSEGNGNSDCVEIGRWRKSTFSEASGNSDCVELARDQALTAIRDSKNPDGGTLTIPDDGWHALRTALNR